MSIIDFKAAKEKFEQKKFDQIVEDGEAEDEWIAEFISEVLINVIDILIEEGYDIRENPEAIRDALMVAEALKGYIYRCKGMEYPMHLITNTLFEIEDAKAATDEFLGLTDDEE